MKRYCIDMSGFSNPASQEVTPQDIHLSLWSLIQALILKGDFAVTEEIHDELVNIPDPLGTFIKDNKKNIVLEVSDNAWAATDYLNHAVRMQYDHQSYIREYNSGSKGTVGLNDISIIALAKTLNVPVISMERRKADRTTKKRAIPDICDLESVQHLTFNDFLRAEGITI